MRKIKFVLVVLSLVMSCHTFAAIHYVGVGAQCNGANHHSTLALALLSAAFNGAENDEVRLTNTVSYMSNGDGSTTLSGWNGSGAGELTIAGGYANCGDPTNDLNAIVGGGSDAVFDVGNNSVVTLRDIQLVDSDSRGLIIDGNSSVFLDSAVVASNVAGVRVLGGSFLSVDENSLIAANGDLADIPKGGGIWCFGINTAVEIAGVVSGNQATSGGNVYVEDGCFVELIGGSRITGSRQFAEKNAESGGGIMVHDGGELFANGGADRVIINDHWADFGGAIYVWGTGRATLLNTFIAQNKAFERGSGLYAINGGSGVTQVTMDRAAACPFLISCSEFEANDYSNFGVVYVSNSRVQISRTIFEANVFSPTDFVISGLIHTTASGVTRLSHVNMLNNQAEHLMVNFGDMEVAHLTAIGNAYDEDDFGSGDSFAWVNLGDLRIENSIWQDTQGGDDRGGTILGKCNLIDVVGEWPGGTYVIGSADFINPAGGDSRQISSSDGVDMCTRDTFAWNIDRDIEYQVSPVNENTNPQGAPGEVGGLFDAGFDEVYDNIGADEFLLTIQKEGSGSGSVVSTPLGIACGTDCTEVYFNGTQVTLFPNASAGSEFIGWGNCPVVNGSNQCEVSVTASQTIFAEFQPDDLIFGDGFD